MNRLTLEYIITGALLLFVLGGAAFSTSAEATPLFLQWETEKGMHEDTFDLSNPEDRQRFREDFKGNPKIFGCTQRADYAVELMSERDTGTSEQHHLDVMEANYERTKTEPEGAISWHVYVDFERMVRDLHRFSGGQFFFTDPDSHWEREFRWCYIDASNWPDSW